MATLQTAPVTPDLRRVRDALAESAPLALLLKRQRESQRRYELACAALPPGLAAHVRAGPLDAETWTLLAANTAVAAKLRQLQPRIDAVLRDHGLPACALRIRALPA